MARFEKIPGKSKDYEKTIDNIHEYWSLERDSLSEEVIQTPKIAPRPVKKQEALRDYLKSCLKSDRLVLKALVGLQLQGYQESILPEDYMVEVEHGCLNLYKIAQDGSREYYKSPFTGKEVKAFPLLDVLTRTDTLYFKSGGYEKGMSSKKVSTSHAEARQMVLQALEGESFARLTGMVNGVAIRQRVRIADHHAVSAQEILFLFRNRPSVFDAQTLDWIHRQGNLEALELVSEGKWEEMNTPGTKAFRLARSSVGVIQLTLAWKRLRSVLPDDLVEQIHSKSLDPDRLRPLQMTLAQTESNEGNARAEDRRVVVESIIPASVAVEDEAKTDEEFREVGAEEISDQQKVENDEERLESEEDDLKNGESPSETFDSGSNAPDSLDDTEIPAQDQEDIKSPEEIAQESWEEQKALLIFLANYYPQISVNFRGMKNNYFEKQVLLSYTSDDLQDNRAPIKVSEAFEVELPRTAEEHPTYKKGEQILLDSEEVIEDMAKTIIERLSVPAANELEGILQSEVAELYGKEKRKAKKGNFDEVMPKIRKYYAGRESLEMQALLGAHTKISTGYFEGGRLGGDPWSFDVVSKNGEIGFEIGGGKMKNKIFYSLESDAKYEVES